MHDLDLDTVSVVDIEACPDAVVAELAGAGPAPQDAVVVSLLDPAALSAAGRVDLLVTLERQAAWVAAQQQRLLAGMVVDGDADPYGWVREDVAAALRLSGDNRAAAAGRGADPGRTAPGDVGVVGAR